MNKFKEKKYMKFFTNKLTIYIGMLVCFFGLGFVLGSNIERDLSLMQCQHSGWNFVDEAFYGIKKDEPDEIAARLYFHKLVTKKCVEIIRG